MLGSRFGSFVLSALFVSSMIGCIADNIAVPDTTESEQDVTFSHAYGLSASDDVAPDPALEATEAYDGLWSVTDMRCNGEAANAQTMNMYTKPNYITVRIDGESGYFDDLVNGCHKVIPLQFVYPTENTMVAAFSGPIECAPANCDSGCGLYLPLTPAYEVRRERKTLYWTSIGPVDDNCSKNGQENPIDYTMRKQRE